VLFEKVAAEIEGIDDLIKELQPGIDSMPTLTQAKFDKATATGNMEAEIAELGFWAPITSACKNPNTKPSSRRRSITSEPR
ncbi:MAG: hypothetical protein M3Q32_10750, partial [Pseudomonadota bacterium]|nr:hypothetical protein [Pseudomonadota bacterium]